MSILKRILGSLEARLSQPRVSIWRSIYFNFRTLPFKQAIKLPVYIYSGHRLFILEGKVQIQGPIYKGMIQIGKNTESFSMCDHSGFIQINEGCNLIFQGPAKLGVNTKLRLVSSDVTFGKNVFIGTGVRVIANGSYIKIGEGSRIAFESVIMNSSFHFTYNETKSGYSQMSNPIIIGDFNWIGNRSSISGNAHSKDFTIVCAGSLVNKDFTSIDGEYPMLGGQPAKLITNGIKRVFSPVIHNQVSKWFEENPGEKFWQTQELFDNLSDLKKEF